MARIGSDISGTGPDKSRYFCRVPSDELNQPPTPVIVAVVLTGLVAAASLVGVIVGIIVLSPLAALGALVALLWGATAYGLWQGTRGSRVVAIILGVGLISAFGSRDPGLVLVQPLLAIYGITIIVLLVGPRSSRAWFTPRH